MERRSNLLLFLFFLFLSSFFTSIVFNLSPTRASSTPEATITSFTSAPDDLEASDTTYTIRFKFNDTFTAGENSKIELTLVRIADKYGADNTSNIATVAGTVSSLEFVESGNPIAFTEDLSYPQFTDQSQLRYLITDLETNIPANTLVELTITGANNPEKAGVYAFSMAAISHTDTIFSSYPQYDPGQNSYFVFGEPCLKAKIVYPDGETAASSSGVYIHNSNHSINTWIRADYNGVAAVSGDAFWGTETCPSEEDQKLFIYAEPPDDDTSVAKAPVKEAILPGDKITHFETPIRLSSIQLTGVLKTHDGENISYAGINVMPNDFDPSKSTWANSDENGAFSVGGMLPGSYQVEFQMPWDSQYTGITNPEPLLNLIVDEEGKVTYGDCTAETTCDLPTIIFPAATKSISGRILDTDGNPINSGRIEAFKDMGMGRGETTTDSNGDYTLSLGGGVWGVMPLPDWDSDWMFCEMPRFFTFANNDSVEERTAANTNNKTNFLVKRATTTVSGRVLYPDGSPFDQGGIEIRSKEGCGAHSSVDMNTGRFSLQVAPGTYNVFVQAWTQDYSSPANQTTTVGSSDVDLGDITMIEKKDLLTGRIWADKNANGSYDSGEGVANQIVSAMKLNKMSDDFGGQGGMMGGGDFAHQETDSAGNYTLKVTPGSWMINVMSDPGMMGGYSSSSVNYIYTGSPQQVNITSSDNGATFSGNDFQLVAADATISGKLIDESSNPITGVWGFAFADSGTGGGPMMGAGMGAPLQNGSFTLKVPAGNYNIGVDFPPDSAGYTPASQTSVTAVAGETTSVNIKVKPNNSRIKVNFLNNKGQPVTDLAYAEIFAHNNSGGHIFKPLFGAELTSGSTTINVAEGTWSIGYFINPTDNNYMSEPMARNNRIAVSSSNDDSNPAETNIVLRAADSQISGRVTDPSGDPLSGVWISTDNRKVSNFDFAGPMFMSGDTTDENGNYSISLPGGSYQVQAFLPPSMGYINPRGVEVTIDPSNSATADLQFGQSDAAISGTVYLNDNHSEAFISAFSDQGGYSETTSSGGSYTLNVTKDATWYLKAMYESDSDFYHSSIQEVEMEGSSAKTQNLTLNKASFTIPEAVSTTFDYQNAKKITLSNGFSISIPAGAISPTSSASGNNITVSISPTAQMSTQNMATPIGVGYDITATDDSGSLISSSFNNNVTITIPYTDDYLLEALGVSDESSLDNGYWDTATSAWKGINGTVIDTESKTISFTINHFTTFSILSASDTTGSSTSTNDSDDSSSTSSSSSSSTSSSTEDKPDVSKESGKVVKRANGQVVLMISANALKWDADIQAKKLDKSSSFIDEAFENGHLTVGYNNPRPPLWIATGPFDIKMTSWFNGAIFSELNEPSTLIIKYDPSALGLIPENSLKLNKYNEASKRWVALPSLLITERNEVAIVLNEIGGKYALIGGFGYQWSSLEQYGSSGLQSTTEETDTVSSLDNSDSNNDSSDDNEQLEQTSQDSLDTSQEQQEQPTEESEKNWLGRILDRVKGVIFGR